MSTRTQKYKIRNFESGTLTKFSSNNTYIISNLHGVKFMRSVVLTLLAILALTSCATVENMRNLQEGQTKEEVITAVGSPSGFHRSGEYEVLQYTNLLINGWSIFSGLSWNRTDYSVILKNDRVIEYGPGKIIKRKQNETPYTLIQEQYLANFGLLIFTCYKIDIVKSKYIKNYLIIRDTIFSTVFFSTSFFL